MVTNRPEKTYKKQVAEPCEPPLPGTRTSAVRPPPGVVPSRRSREQRGAGDRAGDAERRTGHDVAHVVDAEPDA